MPIQEKDDDLTLSNDTSDLIFPLTNQNEIGNWMTFERKEYQKLDMFKNSTYTNAKGARKIVVPIPMGLETSYSSEWSGDSLGIWGNFLRDEGSKVIKAGMNMYKNSEDVNSIVDSIMGLTIGDVKDKGMNLVQQFGLDGVKDLTKKAGGAYLKDKAITSNVFSETGAFTGIARNPYKAVLYRSPNFRNFTLSYKFMAKNYKEAVNIREIIKEFHLGMAPDFEKNMGNDIYSYPDLFEISLTDDSFLFKFSPCVITQCATEYHAEGPPVYINGPNNEQIPASVKINLMFQETVILTKTDFEKNGV